MKKSLLGWVCGLFVTADMINDLILLTTVFVQSWMQLPQCITQVVIYKNYVLKKDVFHDLIQKRCVSWCKPADYELKELYHIGDTVTQRWPSWHSFCCLYC